MDKVTIVCVDKTDAVPHMSERLFQEMNFNFVNYVELKGMSGNDITKAITDIKEQFVVCIDMAGYERKTLLEDTIYNIMPVKQLHLITNKRLWEKNRCQAAALNQYIALPDETIDIVQFREFKEDIPNLIEYPAFERNKQGILDSERNFDIMKQIVQTAVTDAY